MTDPVQAEPDLVERLREVPRGAGYSIQREGYRTVIPYGNMMNEAADEIERLRMRLAQAADNLEAGDRLYQCPGLHAAAKIARAALGSKTDD